MRLLLCLAALALPAFSLDPIPAFRPGSRILFQGDSITDMNRGGAADPNHILGHSFVFLIAAQSGAAFPERNLVFINRGVSGNTLPMLAARWQQDPLDLQPDLLTILIGINDAWPASLTRVRREAQEKAVDTRRALLSAPRRTSTVRRAR